jgi:hypothetical protein
MAMGSFIFAGLFLATLQPPGQIGPPVPPPARPRTSEETPPEDGEIVVRGERYDENSPYRVPMQFRNQRSDEDRHASWDARWRDEEALGRFSDQTVGPFGALQRSRQTDCEWRAARQEMRGERPDCGKGMPF